MYRMLIVLCFLAWGGLLRATPSQGWVEEYPAALERAQREGRIVLIAFLGCSPCPWSARLQEEVLDRGEFCDLLNKEMILVKVHLALEPKDDPSCVLVNSLREKHKIRQCPTLVLVEPSGEEICQIGYLVAGALDFVHRIQGLANEFTNLRRSLARGGLSESDLETLYLKAQTFGFHNECNRILVAGLQAERGTFFGLEQYARLVEGGKKREARSLRQQLVERDVDGSAHLKLAMIDFRAKASFVGGAEDPENAVLPLIEYTREFGRNNRDNLWRVEMMIAQYLFSKNNVASALEHARLSYEYAPREIQNEIAESIKYLERESRVEW